MPPTPLSARFRRDRRRRAATSSPPPPWGASGGGRAITSAASMIGCWPISGSAGCCSASNAPRRPGNSDDHLKGTPIHDLSCPPHLLQTAPAERPVRSAHREPLREQLRRRRPPAECH